MTSHARIHTKTARTEHGGEYRVIDFANVIRLVIDSGELAAAIDLSPREAVELAIALRSAEAAHSGQPGIAEARSAI